METGFTSLASAASTRSRPRAGRVTSESSTHGGTPRGSRSSATGNFCGSGALRWKLRSAEAQADRGPEQRPRERVLQKRRVRERVHDKSRERRRDRTASNQLSRRRLRSTQPAEALPDERERREEDEDVGREP